MSKNITYHQTAARKGRRTRNDSAAIGGLGLAGLAATPKKPGFFGNSHLRESANETNRIASAEHRASSSFSGADRVKGHVATEMGRVANLAGDVRHTVHPGRGLAEAAVGVGAAGIAAGEARNFHHTRQEQKLRRNRGVSKSAFLDESVSKAMKGRQVYCKQHGKFDACAESVEKAYKAKPKPGDPGFMGHAIKNAHKRHRAALQRSKTENLGDNGIVHAVGKAAKFPQGGDDGIRHLTGTSHITTSVEGRGTGKLVACEVGNRQFDGTPMMGHAKGHAAILRQDKQGKSSPATAAVGGTSLREQVPGKSVSKAHEADPFEVFSKASMFGTKGDKRNTKYYAAATGGSTLGGLVGRSAGGEVAGVAGNRTAFEAAKAGHEAATDATLSSRAWGGGAIESIKAGQKAAKVARNAVPGYKAVERGGLIGAGVGAAGAAGAYAMHRHNKGMGVQKSADPFEVEKAENKNVRASGAARYGLGPIFTAKKGKKLAATGTMFGHSLGGAVGGGVTGAGAGAAIGRVVGGKEGMIGGASLGALGGEIAGSVAGARHAADKNARLGRLKSHYVVQKSAFLDEGVSKAVKKAERPEEAKKGQHPPEVHAYIAEKKKDLSKSHDAFLVDIEKFDGFGAAKNVIPGIRQAGSLAAGAVKTNPMAAGVAGGAVGGGLMGKKKVRDAIGGAAGVGAGIGAAKGVKAFRAFKAI